MATKTVPLDKFFTVSVDGKKYGPFPEGMRDKFKALQHQKGVELVTVWLDGTEYRKQKAESRKQKAESRKQKAESSSSAFIIRWA